MDSGEEVLSGSHDEMEGDAEKTRDQERLGSK